MDRCYESHIKSYVDNGCPQCEQINGLCLDCQLEQAEHDVLRDMNIVEQLKKEKEHANSR